MEFIDNNVHPDRPRVVDLLDGMHHFCIPSYQRGYRWEIKQVTDLLNDIRAFVANPDQKDYYLQPLVVKRTHDSDGNVIWQVLDGQQRLTTIYLILEYIYDHLVREVQRSRKSKIYTLRYETRGNFINESLDPTMNIDAYYIWEARSEIESWYRTMVDAGMWNTIDKMTSALIDNDADKRVRFIWYEVNQNSEDFNGLKDLKNREIEDIKAFNRLNNGRIGLTGAELIKALFIMDANKRGEDCRQLSIEWDAMERKFQDDEFWSFIAPKTLNCQSRIDLLFDFICERKDSDDQDYSYRLFQSLYDRQYTDTGNTDKRDAAADIWAKNGIQTMQGAWVQTKRYFDNLCQWYADNTFYHYVGYLTAIGKKQPEIQRMLKDAKAASDRPDRWSQSDNERTLQDFIIKESFCIRPTGNDDSRGIQTASDIDTWEYGNSPDQRFIFRLLLLFNIESYRLSGTYRFSFSKFSDEDWDLEHVASQNESTLQKPDDQLTWLTNAAIALRLERDKNANALADELDRFVREKRYDADGNPVPDDQLKDVKNGYNSLYAKVAQYYEPIEEKDRPIKHRFGNLTLLNARINRGYKDAPFPFKRYTIINEDRKGAFIPMCTRNLFLKYYTGDDAGYLRALRWIRHDQDEYERAIHTLLDPWFDRVENQRKKK